MDGEVSAGAGAIPRRRFWHSLVPRPGAVELLKDEVIPSPSARVGGYWPWIVVAATVLGILFRQEAFLFLAATLAALVGVSWLWAKYAFVGMEYRRVLGERRAFLGEEVDVEISVSNRKLLPLLWLRVGDAVPRNLPIEGGNTVLSGSTQRNVLQMFFTIPGRRKVVQRLKVRCVERGFMRFGPVTMESGDPFGFFTHRRTIDYKSWLVVYPRMLPLERLGIVAKNPFGDFKSRWTIFAEPSKPMGVRDYRPGDRFRDIHWKATAHRQKLQTRVYEPGTSHNLALFLNVATMPLAWQGTIPEALEEVVTIAASVCGYASERKWLVGLYANGSLPESDVPIRIPPGRSPQQLMVILEHLAAITAFAVSPMEEMLVLEAPSLPWGASVVLVSAVVTPAHVDALQRIRSGGHPVAIVTLEDAEIPAGTEGIDVYRVPPGATLSFEKVEALE